MNMETTVTRDDDTGDIIVGEEQIAVEPKVQGHGENLALTIDDNQLDTVGIYVTEKADADKKSRAEWEEQNARAMQLLGIGPESEPNAIDYEDANTSDHPLLLSALTRFQASALSELLPPEKVCTGVAAFDLTGLDRQQRGEAERDIEKAIDRVEAYYLDYLGDQLPSYEEDTDLILRDCGLHGIGFRKVYVDPTVTSPVRADHVPVEDLFISYDAKSTKCGRITHRMFCKAHDMVRMMQAGLYRVIDLDSGTLPEHDTVTEQRDIIQGLTASSMDGNEGHTLYETHCMLFLEGDPHPKMLARPYVVTVHVSTGKVLSLRRNWVESDPDEKPIPAFVAYPYHPGKSAIFALGLGALLANQTEALRDGQRAALDAGYLANHPAGFKKSSLSIREDNTRVMPGEFVDVDSPGAGPISDALMLHPFRGPDQGLMALIDKMEMNGKELGGVATADLSGMMGSSVSPGPALAALDEQTKFQSAVHRRLYRANRTELRMIHDRMREIFANQPVQFGVNSVLQPTDLIMVNLLPAMDPSQVSRSRRMIESQVKLDTAEKFPDVLDKRAAVIDFLNATGTSDIDHLLLPERQEAKPADPVTEYGNVMRGKPLKAGQAQNHAAHIDAHTANMQGVQSSNLTTEQGGAVMASLAAHIADHMSLDLAVQVSAAMGIPLEALAEGLPPEVEYQIAPMMAQAIAQVEKMRAGTNPEDTKIQIEQMRAANKIEVERIRGEFNLQRETMQGQQNTDDNQTSTLNNKEDNITALLLAGIKSSGGGGKSSINPRSTNPNPSPPSNSNNPNPKPRNRTDQ